MRMKRASSWGFLYRITGLFLMLSTLLVGCGALDRPVTGAVMASCAQGDTCPHVASKAVPTDAPQASTYLPMMEAKPSSLATPTGLTIEQDDQNAILQWNGGPLRPDQLLPAGIAGYRVTWGPAAQPDKNSKLTEEQILQLQPLVNGQTYVARVQAVDSLGQLSALSEPISFTGDPARVNALRAKMNGFFDDFNLPEGAPDERKWNSAFSRCNAPASNGFFINNQVHAHNTVASATCDRGQSISRPRAALDFSDNGTRTIVFDFDGEFRRDQWYLDLVPRMMDISGQVSIEAGGDTRADPANGLRFHQTEQGLRIIAFTPSGAEETLAMTDGNPFQTLDWLGLKLVSNVRRQWEIRLSRTSVEMFINGQKVLATQPNTFHLSENSYTLLWNVFSYNTGKSNEPMVLAHWDNFGFDAPAGTQHDLVTHNYRLVNSGTDFVEAFAGDQGSPATVTLNIPDQVQGAQARRLMFTLQMDANTFYTWNPADKVSVNGHDFPIAQPVSNAQPPLDMEQLVSTIAPYSIVIPLPDGVLQQGQNRVVFSTAASSFHNIHVELDFPASAEPAYTPPAQALDGKVLPQLPAVGPDAMITQIGTTDVEEWADNLSDSATFNPTVKGIVPVQVEIHSDIALHGTGANPGIAQIELLVDGKVIQMQRTDAQIPAPSVHYTFQLDTHQFGDGTHEIYVRAYNPSCVASITDYMGVGPVSGKYYPIHFTVKNGSGKPTVPISMNMGNTLCQAPANQMLDHQH